MTNAEDWIKEIVERIGGAISDSPVVKDALRRALMDVVHATAETMRERCAQEAARMDGFADSELAAAIRTLPLTGGTK